MIVLFWSRATRDLLKSFGWGIAALHRLDAATKVPFLAARPIGSKSREARPVWECRIAATAAANRGPRISNEAAMSAPFCVRWAQPSTCKGTTIASGNAFAISMTSFVSMVRWKGPRVSGSAGKWQH